MKEDKTVYIIILNWNGFELTKECIESFSYVNTPHKLILVDNGSTDGSKEKLEAEFPYHTLIANEKNLGYAGGNNTGIKYALKQNASYILILNNDTVVAPDFLDTFIEHEAQQTRESVLGAKVVSYYQRRQLDHLGGVWNSQTHNFDLIGKEAAVQDTTPFNKPLDYLTGCALFAKGSTFKKVGLFDPRYFLFWEEVDWCYRAKQMGVALRVCPNAILYHKGSASFDSGSPHKTYFWWRSRLLWLEKHTGKQKHVIQQEMPRLLSLYCLSHLHLLGYLLTLNKKRVRKQQQIKRLKASLRGIFDYRLHRFGALPRGLRCSEKK